jgi:hypothetical protein
VEETQAGNVGKMVERFLELRSIIEGHLRERMELQERLTGMGIRLVGMARVRNKASAPTRRRRRTAVAVPESNGVTAEPAE